MHQYTQEKQRIRNSGERALSDEEMRKLNVGKIVLDQMIQSATIEQAAKDLGVIIPKKSIIDVIQAMPQFQTDGIFDEELYASIIQRSGMNENGLLLTPIRENLMKTQLFHPIAVGYKLPSFIKSIIEKDFAIKREIVAADIKLSDIPIKKTPSTEELKEYYLNNTENYKKPEERDCAILVVDYKKLPGAVNISKKDVDKYYEENKAAYEPKEFRDFERFAFENKEEADKARSLMLKKRMSAGEITKKFLAPVEIISKKEKNDFPTDIGRELFNLNISGVSIIYQIGNKFYIYRLINVDKTNVKNEKEIKSEIIEILKSEQINTPEYYSKIKDIKNKIDDGFGSGKSIDDIAKDTGMQIVELKSFSKAHINQELENLIPDKETKTEIIEVIFNTNAKQASPIIDSKATDTVSYVVYIRKIDPAKIPSFEEIEDFVKDDFYRNEKNTNALEKIDMINKKGAGASAEILKLNEVRKYKISKKDILLYEKEYSTEVEKILKQIPNINILFNVVSSLKNGHSTHFKTATGDYIIIASRKISDKAADDSSEFAKVISNHIDSNTANDIIPLAINAFKGKMKVKIDKELVEEITKTSDSNENN
jgi:peptidyl-prolyl cis-trans isomerase D